ncbi:MCP four helix bundle domain-containing protein [Sinorhizobium sp. NFACC03]|uniref:MCP four helix bundle domain-containing protein n=1 Tax=Sinorhizobium sp. NFACC03 TaxID=1566295 RepID=UPI0025700A2D|nr:MCP four helix bundle domain-containing protein [Sinorhizobium sp. NFACC03]
MDLLRHGARNLSQGSRPPGSRLFFRYGSVKASLLSLICTIIVVVSTSSIISLRNIRSITLSAEKVGNFWIERLLASREVKGNFADVRLSLARFATMVSETEFEAETQSLDAAKAKLATSITKYQAGVFSPVGRSLITDISRLTSRYLAQADRYIDLVRAHDIELLIEDSNLFLVVRQEHPVRRCHVV